MAINSVSGSTSNLPLRPETPRNNPPAPQQQARSEEAPRRQPADDASRARQNTPPTTPDTAQPDLPRLDAATEQRSERSNDIPRRPPFEVESTAVQNRRALAAPSEDSLETANSRVERADQARDALKARFEESSRPKPEAAFEVRA